MRGLGSRLGCKQTCNHRCAYRHIVLCKANGPKSTPNPASTQACEDTDIGVKRFQSFLVATLSSCALALSASTPALSAEGVTIRFPASRNPEIRSAQELLVQTWGYVRELYYDPTFNHQDWEQALQDALSATFRASTRDEALAAVGPMLASLDDPFTRLLLPGGASEAFEALQQAKIVSTGLLVASSTGPDGGLKVSYVVPGSPAAAAGLVEGDQVVAVNGRPVWGLRGGLDASLQEQLQQDREVTLKLRRTPATTPLKQSVSGSPQAAPTFLDVRLRPGPVEFLPVQYAVLTSGRTAGSGSRTATGNLAGGSAPDAETAGVAAATVRIGDLEVTGSRSFTTAVSEASAAVSSIPADRRRVGYIRISVFTENVGEQVETAINKLKAAGCGSWLLDLRENPGGIVSEGQAVAELMLRPGDVFARVRGRSREEVVERVSASARDLLGGQPVAVLVDYFSASTSELVAGALHDDVHALLLGQQTYGKGRTQRVIELPGGATLLVSTDTYVTPSGRLVDRVGLAPDIVCWTGPPPPPMPRAAPTLAGQAGTAEKEGVDHGNGDASGHVNDDGGGGKLEELQLAGLTRDACVRAALGKLTRGSVVGRHGGE